RSELGAALLAGAAADQSLARHCGRHGKRHHRCQWISPPRTLRHSSLRLGQAAPRRDQIAGCGECVLRGSGGAAPGDWTEGARAAAGTSRDAAFPQAALVRRAPFPLTYNSACPGFQARDGLRSPVPGLVAFQELLKRFPRLDAETLL